MSKIHALAGKRFGKLTVIHTSGERRRGQIVWVCKCDCGIVKNIPSYSLTSGGVVSCGCHGRAILGINTTTHGKSNSPEHRTWKGLRMRCNNPKNPKFPRYGGRGIKVCERWNEFENFMADMGVKPGPCHSIHRINNDGNYEPSNCKWSEKVEQANNTSANRNITFENRTMTLAQWGKTTGLSVATIRSRIDKLGWPIELALSTPKRGGHV